MPERAKGPRLVGVAALGFLLFNYPLLAVFDADARVLGLPLVFAYLFAAWSLLDALLAWIARDS